MKRITDWPIRGQLGVCLVATCWPLNWALPGNRTAYLFFPLWLGYVLVVDALVERRTGTSIWMRSRKNFVLLFLASAPVWWLFEVINWRTRNWEYRGSEQFSLFEYHLLCTLCFSTVMPAVFETAELVRSLPSISRLARGRIVSPSRGLLWTLLIAGIAMLVLMMAWPRYFYPFVWISLVFILEPLNRWMGRRHFLQYLQRGDWGPVVSLGVGALLCGFFWEMWNYWSWPKWVYHTPGAEFLHVFEMPLLGYGGYIPFGFELFLLAHLLLPRSLDLRL